MQIINSKSELDTFIKHAEEGSHSKFVSISVERSYSDKEWQPLHTNRVYWQWSGGGGMPSIEFTGVPFMFVGSKRLGCHRGKDRAVAQKKKYAEEKAKKMTEDYSSLSRMSLSQHTKKVGCLATIFISKIAMFPKFKVTDNRERSRKRASKMLRLALQRDSVDWETCFVITHQSEHNGHEKDEMVESKTRRRKRQMEHEMTDCALPPQKRAKKAHLKKKCIRLTKQLTDKLYFIEDQDKLEELSGKLSNLVEDLTALNNSENERPLQTETKRTRGLSTFTTSTLTQKTTQRLKSKYTERLWDKVCRKSPAQVSVWPVHPVAQTL